MGEWRNMLLHLLMKNWEDIIVNLAALLRVVVVALICFDYLLHSTCLIAIFLDLSLCVDWRSDTEVWIYLDTSGCALLVSTFSSTWKLHQGNNDDTLPASAKNPDEIIIPTTKSADNPEPSSKSYTLCTHLNVCKRFCTDIGCRPSYWRSSVKIPEESTAKNPDTRVENT